MEIRFKNTRDACNTRNETHCGSTRSSQKICIQSRSLFLPSVFVWLLLSSPCTSCHIDSLSMNDSRRSWVDGAAIFLLDVEEVQQNLDLRSVEEVTSKGLEKEICGECTLTHVAPAVPAKLPPLPHTPDHLPRSSTSSRNSEHTTSWPPRFHPRRHRRKEFLGVQRGTCLMRSCSRSAWRGWGVVLDVEARLTRRRDGTRRFKGIID